MTPDGTPCLTRMLWYAFLSMMPSIFTKSPVPAAAMAPHTIILPPPCLTVGKRHSFLYLSPSLRRTYTLCLLPNCSNLDSSVHSTLYQSSFVHFLCYFANFSHFALFFSFSNGFSENLVRAPWNAIINGAPKS